MSRASCSVLFSRSASATADASAAATSAGRKASASLPPSSCNTLSSSSRPASAPPASRRGPQWARARCSRQRRSPKSKSGRGGGPATSTPSPESVVRSRPDRQPEGPGACGLEAAAGRQAEFAGARRWAGSLALQRADQLADARQVIGAIGVAEVDPDAARQQRRHLGILQQHRDQPLPALDGAPHQRRVLRLHVRPRQRRRRDDEDAAAAGEDAGIEPVHEDIARRDVPLVEEQLETRLVQVLGQRAHPVRIGVTVGNEDVPLVDGRGRRPCLAPAGDMVVIQTCASSCRKRANGASPVPGATDDIARKLPGYRDRLVRRCRGPAAAVFRKPTAYAAPLKLVMQPPGEGLVGVGCSMDEYVFRRYRHLAACLA